MLRIYISGGPRRQRFQNGMTQDEIGRELKRLNKHIEVVKSGHTEFIVIDDGTKRCDGPSNTALKTGGKVIEYSKFKNWLMKHTTNTTRKSTKKATKKVTRKSTKKATRNSTKKATRKSTKKSMRKSTKKATKKATRKSTKKSTRKATRKATRKSIKKKGGKARHSYKGNMDVMEPSKPEMCEEKLASILMEYVKSLVFYIDSYMQKMANVQEKRELVKSQIVAMVAMLHAPSKTASETMLDAFERHIMHIDELMEVGSRHCAQTKQDQKMLTFKIMTLFENFEAGLLPYFVTLVSKDNLNVVEDNMHEIDRYLVDLILSFCNGKAFPMVKSTFDLYIPISKLARVLCISTK